MFRLLAFRPERLDALTGRVVQFPVLVPLARYYISRSS